MTTVLLSSACTATGNGPATSATGGSTISTAHSGSAGAPAGSGAVSTLVTASSSDDPGDQPEPSPARSTSDAGDSTDASPSASAPGFGPHVALVLIAQTPDGTDPSAGDLARSAELLRDRVASITGATVTEVPPRRIRLQAPGTDVTAFDDLIRRGVLTLRPVVSTWRPLLAASAAASSTVAPVSTATGGSSPSTTSPAAQGFPSGSDPQVPTQPSADSPAGWKKWTANASRYTTGATPPSCTAINRYQDLADPDKPLLACDIDGNDGYLLGPTVIPGSAISRATAARGTGGVPGWVVDVTFSINAQHAWATYTGEHIGQQIALTLDGQVLSAPQIVQQINGGAEQINGTFTRTEATDLAQWLGAGALPLAFRVNSRQVVG